MVPFYTKFRELANVETRVITVIGSPDLPDGEYGFLESFCDEINCDCHRVLINIISHNNPKRILATINFGWKSNEFYSKFLLGINFGIPNNNPKGPYLDPLNPQSEYAPILLKMFIELLKDQNYVDRIERHYLLFKQAIKDDAVLKNKKPKLTKLEKKKKRKLEKKQRKKNR